MTVHRAKGLEADYAVVLGLCAGKHGFPVEIADDPLLDLVLAAPEALPNAEERRLLYVALTRARRKVFLLAEGGPPYAFVTELIDGKYDVTVFGRLPEGRCALSDLQGRASGTAGKTPATGAFSTAARTGLLRAHRAPVPELWDWPAGQVRRRLPLPRLRRIDRGLSRLRRLAGNQNGQVRPLPGMLEFSGLQLHAQPAEASNGA